MAPVREKYAAIKTYVKEREKLFFFAKIVIALGLLAYLVDRVGSVEIANVFASANYYYVALAGALLVPNLYFQYARWNALVARALRVEDKRVVWRSLFYGLAGGAFTPARVGEYVGRGVAFRDRSLLEVSIVTFIDKFFTLVVIAFAGAASAILFLAWRYHISPPFAVALFVALGGATAFVFFAVSSDRFWREVIYPALTSIKWMRSFVERLRALRRLDSRTLTFAGAYSFGLYAVMLLQYTVLAAAFSGDADFLWFAWGGALTFFVKALVPSISLGDVGVREAASIYFLSQFGVSDEIGFNAAFTLFIFNVLIPSLIGFALLFKRNK